MAKYSKAQKIYYYLGKLRNAKGRKRDWYKARIRNLKNGY